MSAQPFTLGPGALSDTGGPNSNGFASSRPEWVSIQTYCTDGKALVSLCAGPARGGVR